MSPFTYIDHHTPEMVTLLRRLVGLSTVNPPGEHYAEITAQLTTELAAAGLTARRYAIPSALIRRHLPLVKAGERVILVSASSF